MSAIPPSIVQEYTKEMNTGAQKQRLSDKITVRVVRQIILASGANQQGLGRYTQT